MDKDNLRKAHSRRIPGKRDLPDTLKAVFSIKKAAEGFLLIIVYISRMVGPIASIGDMNDITCRVADGAVELVDVRIIRLDDVHYGYGIGIGFRAGPPWPYPGRNRPRGYK